MVKQKRPLTSRAVVVSLDMSVITAGQRGQGSVDIFRQQRLQLKGKITLEGSFGEFYGYG